MIFIDSGAFVAKFRESDAAHTDALRGWALLEKSNRRCLTSNLVIAESANLIARYKNVTAATTFVRGILLSDIHLLRGSVDEDSEAAALMLKYADQRIGYADCVSFAQMKRNRVREVFGFDRHFQIAGFKLWPGSKFKD